MHMMLIVHKNGVLSNILTLLGRLLQKNTQQNKHKTNTARYFHLNSKSLSIKQHLIDFRNKKQVNTLPHNDC